MRRVLKLSKYSDVLSWSLLGKKSLGDLEHLQMSELTLDTHYVLGGG